MSAMTKLATVETKLFLREPPAVFWALFFPAILLAGLGGLFPGFLEPVPELDGLRLIDVYMPIVLTMALLTAGVMGLPPVLVAYRQYGILRRLAVTPVGPARLLSSQLLVHLGAAVVAATLALAVAVIGFDVALPKDPLMFGLVFLLAASAMLSIGLLISAVAPTVSAGQGIGMAVYFPMMVLAGVYFPREAMPDGLRIVSDLSPAGAAVQALKDAWIGVMPSGSSLLVMALFAVGAGLLAVRFLRWDRG
jgi:ABC-2 type transport system permease protein